MHIPQIPKERKKEMEHTRRASNLQFSTMSSSFVLLLSIIVICSSSSGSVVVVEAYKNYTVGDSLGWFDSTMKPDINYQKWVSNKVFSLGDFLIFNTDNNHSVIQTYNSTTYKLCDYDDAQDKDTLQWASADPSNIDTHPVSVAVPLLKEGVTYFFSSDYDGDQCRSGQHFNVNVTHGQGLPKSLRDPSEDSPSPASPVSGDDDSAPDTIVPANFSHPKAENSDDDKSSDKEKPNSGSMSMYSQLHSKLYYGSLVFLGLVFLF